MPRPVSLPAAPACGSQRPTAGTTVVLHTVNLTLEVCGSAPRPQAGHHCAATTGSRSTSGSSSTSYKGGSSSRWRAPPQPASLPGEACQTDAAILEALEMPPPEACAGTQTDASLLQPHLGAASLAAVAGCAPTADDAGMQVCEADLFDFERDATPLMRALVRQALERAAGEAAEELRLEAVRRQRRQLEQARYDEQQEVLRLQADSQRRAKEREQLEKEAEALAVRRAQAAFQLVPLEALQHMVQDAAVPVLAGLAEERLRAACA